MRPAGVATVSLASLLLTPRSAIPAVAALLLCFIVVQWQNTAKLKMFYQTQTARRPPKEPKNAAFVPGDLYLQTRLSEGANTSSLQIWCKSVQRFPRYFIHKQKHRLTAPKTEPSAIHCVW